MQRSRDRIAAHVRAMLDAARRLIEEKGDASFTTQELVKEAGVALQTFYRYFAGKDQLLLAVVADAMTEACERWAEAARELPDPLARLRFYVITVLAGVGDSERDEATARFIVATRWQLHRVFPKELADAEQPFVDLLRTEIVAAREAGLLRSADPASDAWFIAELVRSVYHYYAFAPAQPDAAERLWEFCLRALGGPGKGRPRRPRPA
ncbi:TetR/AcrR family transcriptional regulator [Nocardia alni]|uniref:TetR/AcrR family transcriptional regulator n=1 Tax=Nocardia alni TaxID=2815723 RepID=UPI001C22F99B|nr:TetR/AcrR family transcriptional regulator [Nocardia alni]